MNLLGFAFGAGMLATVNPCGFAMLPAFFGLSIGTEPDASGGQPNTSKQPAPAARITRGFGAGLAVSAGFSAVFTIVGVLVALGLRQVVRAVPVVAIVVGGVLAVAGLATVLGHPIKLRSSRSSFRSGIWSGSGRADSRRGSGGGHGIRRMVAFGAGYAVASLSCTLGVLLAVVAQATATGQPAQTIAVFAAYATGATAILVGVAIAASLARAGLAATIRRAMPTVSRIAGALLTVSGLYLVVYWWPALTGRPPDARIGGFADELSGWVSRAVESHTGDRRRGGRDPRRSCRDTGRNTTPHRRVDSHSCIRGRGRSRPRLAGWQSRVQLRIGGHAQLHTSSRRRLAVTAAVTGALTEAVTWAMVGLTFESGRRFTVEA